MNFQNNRYTLRLADSGDNDGIRGIFHSEGFSGGLSVKYLRDPNPFDSFCADGDSAVILVISDNENRRIAAVGGAVIRMEYVGGAAEKCAYLTGLKIHPDYRGKISFIAKSYSFLREHIADCKYCYTTILDDNSYAVSLLEKRRKNMPVYSYLGHYTTYCFHGGKRIIPVETDNLNGFDGLIERYFSRMNHVPVYYKCSGFGEGHFYSVRENGEIIACCFISNQQATKQYKMLSYGGVYRLISKLPTRLLGYPEFPKADSIINHGVVSYLYVKNNDKRLCSDFLRSAANLTDFSLLLWGGFESNPLCRAMDGMRCVKYGSRFYSVAWGGETLPSGIIGAEAGLL